MVIDKNMPHVSKHTKKINPKTLEEMSEKLFKTIAILKNKKEVDLFLNNLLTNTEKIMLAKRIIIAMMLKKNYSYPEIGNILKVGNSTISSMSEKLNKKFAGFEIILERLEAEESTAKFFENTKQSLSKFKIPPRGKGRWNFLKSQ